MPKESEKDTERYLAKKVVKNGGQCYKWVSPGVSGVPDRICIFPHVVAFIEIKSENQSLKPAQVLMHRELYKVTPHVYTVWTKHDVNMVIQLLFNQGENNVSELSS